MADHAAPLVGREVAAGQEDRDGVRLLVREFDGLTARSRNAVERRALVPRLTARLPAEVDPAAIIGPSHIGRRLAHMLRPAHDVGDGKFEARTRLLRRGRRKGREYDDRGEECAAKDLHRLAPLQSWEDLECTRARPIRSSTVRVRSTTHGARSMVSRRPVYGQSPAAALDCIRPHATHPLRTRSARRPREASFPARLFDSPGPGPSATAVFRCAQTAPDRGGPRRFHREKRRCWIR